MPNTIREMNEIRKYAVITYREDILKALHTQSKAMFEGDWIAAQNMCESIVDIANMLSGELVEQEKL